MRGATVRTACLTLAALTVPAAAGFFVYGYGRAWSFMPSLKDMQLAMAVTGIVVGLFVAAPLVAARDLVWGVMLSVRRRRAGRGLCWRCTYDQTNAPTDTCAECGADASFVPTTRCPRPATVFILLALGAAASAMGALVAELHITNEDARFIEHVRSNGGQQWMGRDRAWPYRGFSTVYNPPYGFHVND
ncbi:MAG: hypothetical protein ACIAS6_11495 [Phycisphaerales bacterium JB060]